MAAIALIVLTQDGLTRPAGDAIHDGVTAKAVTIENDTGGTDVTSWVIEILDVPSGPLPAETSAIPTGVLASGGASAPSGNFTPDVPGTYYIRLTINGIEIDEVAVCVPNDQGWVNPGYNMGGDAFNFTGNERGWAYFFDRILSYMHANLGGGISGSGTDNHIMRWDGPDAAQDSGLVITDGDDLQGVGDVTFNPAEASIYMEGGYPTVDDKRGQPVAIYGGSASTQTGSTQRKGGDVDIVGGSGPFGGAIAFTIGDGGDVTLEGGYGGFNTDGGDGGDGGDVFLYGGWLGLGGLGVDGVHGSVWVGTYHTTAVGIGDDTTPTTVYGSLSIDSTDATKNYFDLDNGAGAPVSAAGHVSIRSNAGTFEISENGNPWAAPGGGASPWTDTGTVVYVTTTTRNVAIGASSMVGSEKLRVSGSSYHEGNIDIDNSSSPITRYVRVTNTPANTAGSYLVVEAGSGTFGFLNSGGHLFMQGGDGGDDSSWDGADGGNAEVYAGSAGNTTNDTRPGGVGGQAGVYGGPGGDSSGTGSNADGGTGGGAYLSGGTGGDSTGAGLGSGGAGGIATVAAGQGGSPDGLGARAGVYAGRGGLTNGPGGVAHVFGGKGAGTADGGDSFVDGGCALSSGVHGDVNIGTGNTVSTSQTLTATRAVNIARVDNLLGFHGAAAVAQQTITGAKGGNVALTNLLAALATKGLVIDNTT